MYVLCYTIYSIEHYCTHVKKMPAQPLTGWLEPQKTTRSKGVSNGNPGAAEPYSFSV